MFGIFKMMRPAASGSAQDDPANVLHYTDVWQRLRVGGAELTDERLRARLAETVAWCDSLRSLEEFRSTPLKPRLFHDGPDDVVCDLGGNRHLQLRNKGLQVSQQSPITVAGRFLLYFPDENLADGYAEVVSGGFFDVDNLPAYDTWVSMIEDEGHPRDSARRHLLCYVPEPFIEAANAGIDGNPEECIVWLDSTNFSIRQRVEALTSAALVR